MEKTDALGRRRRASQNRGLRSLFPKLPSQYESRVIRMAMPSEIWERIEDLISRSSAPTLPRAYGELVEQLLENFASSSSRVGASFPLQAPPRSTEEAIQGRDWQAWQMQKELALLAASAPERWQALSQDLQ